MVKPLTFKGDKKQKKKRKRAENDLQLQPQGSSSGLDINDSGAKAATADDGSDDDSWVSAEVTEDVTGPIMFVLPTETPSALASDVNGKIFAQPIENIVDGNPASAEPHDVRQVWVASRTAGSSNLCFKGHHGKFLRCDKLGVLSATSEAVSALESFVLVPTPDTTGAFQIKTLRETFVTVRDAAPGTKASAAPELSGDASDISFSTTMRLRMQARFKPRIKASKEEKAREKISRRELEDAVGRRLEDDEVKRLKRARREGDYHEQLLDLKVKGKHDKYG